MSSDEHYTINRPITLFLPPPIRRNKNQNQNEDYKRESGRPVKASLISWGIKSEFIQNMKLKQNLKPEFN